MNVNCKCGGRFKRTDIEGYWDRRYKMIVYRDTDPIKANWKCASCSTIRTQRKRQAKVKEKK